MTPTPILHVGLYTFKPTLSTAEKVISTANILLLKEKCLHAVTGKPYIVSIIAGSNLAPESPYGGGYTHALVITFARREDWLYYKDKDPVHLEFIISNQDWEKGCLIDVGGDEEG